MISDARNGHVSPGIYTEEKDVTYSVKSLGITSLGLVGETLYGPAFENVPIKNWSEFVDYFGGTSTEKFSGNGNPKYELPYIAKSYLEESNNLNVVRVLGLSGYHAGNAWAVKSEKGVVAVLRSVIKYGSSNEPCKEITDSTFEEIVSSITHGVYNEYTVLPGCGNGGNQDESVSGTADKFSLTVTCTDNKVYKYNLSLNAGDSTYIYNVLKNRPNSGSCPIYIDSIYESNIGQITGVTKLTGETYTNYYESYRPAITPWIVSDAEISKQDTDNTKASSRTIEEPVSGVTSGTTSGETSGTISGETSNTTSDSDITCEVKKLFRFITISDGNVANYQVKVSIQNIDPINGTFDVLVRDFNDKDDMPLILERFSKCNLVDGDANYIAYKIGTADGGFVSKSKYIVVEMADNTDLQNRVPCGFLGYPMPNYGDSEIVSAGYNVDYDETIRAKRQFFGFSNLKGIESDIFSYKGRENYLESNETNISKTTHGFHMDSLLEGQEVRIDGVDTKYLFDCVSSATSHESIPRLVKYTPFLNKSIYSDIKTRKFTVCFYGGFDGWDIHRESRTNTDNYKSTKVKVSENTGAFRKITKDDILNGGLNLPNTAITSDYYAYLAGYRVFANPQDVDINLFATPGIDWLNNSLLTEEVIDLIEDSEEGRGGDALYIMTSPNNTDDITELSESFNENINSSYACTYAPWVMYYDTKNKKYLNLPVTKDVVRNMAATDNNSFPWFAPAGMERGGVECVKAQYKTTLTDEDILYENGINPVKSFAQDGVKIWGNKTAYKVDSPLNRINVRRLMIRVKKLITSAAKNLIFTQYDDSLDKQFRGLIEPILADVKSNRGISDYRILTEVTPETRDQHILPAKILIKPTPALEYISISFVVYPESVSFDEN